MKIIEQKIKGVFLIKPKEFIDDRGSFIKVYNKDTFNEYGLDTNFKESYFSVSKKNTIRGMHFQTPPEDHNKLIYVNAGEITDILLDIRIGSNTYGCYLYTNISEKNKNILYIPSGIAHGFLSKEDNTMVTYMQTSCYAPKNDFGIKYNSFNYNWDTKNPIVSTRDNNFIELDKFKSPFILGVNC